MNDVRPIQPSPILPLQHRPGHDIAQAAVAAFLGGELGPLSSSTEAGADRTVVFTGIGTVAHRTMSGPAFSQLMDKAGVRFEVIEVGQSPSELLAHGSWDLALCFSPWKEPMASALSDLTETGLVTGAVDTIIRENGRTIGININMWAAQAVLESACAGAVPTSVLILGSGASARSVALAVRRAWGDQAELTISARNGQAGQNTAQRFGTRWSEPAHLSAHYGSAAPAVVINCTTWGETSESELTPFPFPLQALLTTGSTFVDLNNRVSGLQTAALAVGARILSGTSVRDMNNACRAALAQRIANRQ